MAGIGLDKRKHPLVINCFSVCFLHYFVDSSMTRVLSFFLFMSTIPSTAFETKEVLIHFLNV